MTGRPTIDAEALAAALAERAREQAAGAGGAARAASGGPAPAPPAEPDPEELLDYLAGRLDPERAQRIERRLVADPAAARALLDLAELEAAGREAHAAEGGEGGGGGGTPPADLAVEAGWRELRGRLAAEPAPARRSAPRAPWLLAAALAVVALGLGARVATLTGTLNRPAANVETLELLGGSRGAEEGPLHLDAGEPLLVAISPAERCAGYDAVIEGPGPGDRLAVPGLERDPRGRITLAWRFEPGAYTLRLFGCEPRRELQEHRFRVARPAASAGDGG